MKHSSLEESKTITKTRKREKTKQPSRVLFRDFELSCFRDSISVVAAPLRLGISYFLCALCFLGVSSAAAHAQPNAKIVGEWWESAYLQGARSGYVRTYIKEIDQQGVKVYRATIEMRLNVKRFNDTIQLGMD